jgi:hypothetical protein
MSLFLHVFRRLRQRLGYRPERRYMRGGQGHRRRG